MMLKRMTIAVAMVLALPACMTTPPPDFAAAIAAPGRSDAHRQLDEVRRPAEILAFMGLKRGDRVLDYFTGNGYYAELLRPEGPIYFAGEHLSYILFWQEGAALSAHEAMRLMSAHAAERPSAQRAGT